MVIGDKWNNWTVTELIGEGSFGTVYRIEREEFGYRYLSALKVIRIPQTGTEVTIAKSEGMSEDSINTYFKSMVEDIVSEFAIMSKLRGNSNIVSYEDHSVKKLDDSFGWEIYIRMELLTPLFEYLEDSSLTIRNAIQLGIDLCRAIELCQKYNIIHRDIKPENIFVSEQGSYKLGDFGIARQLEKTSSGMSKKGTYSYMAPEVYKGQPYNSTVDIYSLGIVLYRFLNNNRTPFLPPYPEPIKYTDKEKANLLRMSGEQLLPPCNARGRLSEIILKACAYDPKDRYESAVEMREALESIAYTEEESKIIYPMGDMLSGIEKSSVTSNKQSVEDSFNSTVSMFGNISCSENNELDNDIIIEKSYSLNPTDDNMNCEPLSVSKEGVNEIICIDNSGSYQIEEKEAEQHPTSNVNNEMNQRKAIKPIYLIIGGFVLLICCLIPTIMGLIHHEVPSLVGVEETQVKDLLEDEGLVLNHGEYVFSESVEKGIVISQSIDAGTSVKKGTKVDVVISKGCPVITPNLIGLDKKKAVQETERNHLILTETESVYSYKYKKGSVVKQSPKAGEKLAEGDSIKIVLSKGPEKVQVPNLKGKSLKQAKQLLKKVGLKAVVEKDFSESVDEGKVIRQSRKAGSKVNKYSSLTIVISIGSEPSSPDSNYTDSVDNYESNDYNYNNNKNNNNNGYKDNDVVDID